jgi:hypothetical protein
MVFAVHLNEVRSFFVGAGFPRPSAQGQGDPAPTLALKGTVLILDLQILITLFQLPGNLDQGIGATQLAILS